METMNRAIFGNNITTRRVTMGLGAVLLLASSELHGSTITLSLQTTSAATMAPNQVAEVQVYATFDQPLTTCAFTLSFEGDTDGTIESRTLGPASSDGVVVLSRTSQIPFEDNLPHSTSSGDLRELLVDDSFDGQPGGSTDGVSAGTVLLETFSLRIPMPGQITVRLEDVSGAIARGIPDGALFDVFQVDPAHAAVVFTACNAIDCNTNGIGDNCDIAQGTSADENQNGVPDECETDTDGDGIIDRLDNCPNNPNPDQADADADALGTACDLCTDVDGDGFGAAGLSPETCQKDNCPAIPNADQANIDGDSMGDVCDPDDDNDGVLDEDDNCPGASNTNQADADGDGLGDACDPCSDVDGDGFGATGVAPETCPKDKCPGISDPQQLDTDGDGIGNACDNCPDNANPSQEDTDGDGRANACDNCPSTPNADQKNTDGDSQGDACDSDDDNDGRADIYDNCPLVSNPGWADSDQDGRGDACDNCPSIPNLEQQDGDHDGAGDFCDKCPGHDDRQDQDGDGVPDDCDNCIAYPNPDQANVDQDAYGDLCDGDIDGDGVLNGQDKCPTAPDPDQTDTDNDGKGNACDNCPHVSNANQADADNDGVGDACEILYVKADATGANNGRSWANAFASLQSAMSHAQYYSTVPHEIWVAAGTYKPSLTGFVLQSGMELYGGFAGTETELSQRNLQQNQTILSGDLYDNDFPRNNWPSEPTRSENCHVVLRASNLAAAVIVDGFTLKGGNSRDSYVYSYGAGGGLYVSGSRAEVRNCILEHNAGTPPNVGISPSGGAITVRSGAVQVTNCQFSKNTGNQGGAIHISSEVDQCSIRDTSFSENQSSSCGGAIAATPSVGGTTYPITIERSTFVTNTSAGDVGGGALYSKDHPLTVNDCVFVGNACAGGPGGAIRVHPGFFADTSINRCDFIQNVAREGGAVHFEGGGDRFVIDQSRFEWNEALGTYTEGVWRTGGSGGGARLGQANSVTAVTNSIFAFNTAAADGGGICCGNDNPAVLIGGCKLVGNKAVHGRGGGIYTSSSNTSGLSLLRNCVLNGNRSFQEGGGAHLGHTDVVNCTVVRNKAFEGNLNSNARGRGGGIYCQREVRVRNSIVIWNTGLPHNLLGYDFGDSPASLTYSAISPHTPWPPSASDHNIIISYGVWAYFVDPVGPDGVPGTLDDDLRPGDVGLPYPPSVTIDAGDNTAYGPDETNENTKDVGGRLRFVDYARKTDTGNKDAGDTRDFVDIGAYERQPTD